MKRILVAAATCAIGALGTAGLMFAAPAQADCSSPTVGDPPATNPDFTPPLSPARVVCVFNEQTGTFAMTVNPANQIDTFLHGTDAVPGDSSTNDGLGILDQPATFAKSIGDFLNGPR